MGGGKVGMGREKRGVLLYTYLMFSTKSIVFLHSESGRKIVKNRGRRRRMTFLVL